MASVYERITNALSSLGKRRERSSSAQDGGRSSPSGTSRAPKRFRPWEQSDLHRRLETYKPLTWFAKPDTVGPVPCALRGWINDSNDSLSCEHCNAKLVYPPNVSFDQRQAAAELFSPSLTSKHTATCPWRSTQCNSSLLAYIPTSTNEDLRAMYENLQGKLLKVDVLPEIDAIAIQAVRDAAAPYGSYDDLVMGSAGAGAIVPRGKRPSVRIKDVTDEPEASAPSFSDASFSADGLTPSGGSDSALPTYILQPSKMTPKQKARLLALLGWDIDVLQPDSASGSAALPYTQSAGYSLQHLGVKPKGAAAASSAAAAPGAAGGAGLKAADGALERYPMSSVVLKCPHCNCRTGLWNFAGLRPVPAGRLTPSNQAGGAAALLGPRGGGAAAAAAAGILGGAAEDPLSVTIAGGQYGLHGNTAGARPFGATSSTPFRFGSASSSEPVFGIAALDAEAVQKQPALRAIGAGPSSAAAGPATPGPAAAGGAATPHAALTGRKRKAESTPEPMAVDAAAAARPATPAGAGALAEGKRQRVESQGGLGVGASPLPGRGHTPGSADVQMRELDPVGEHRSWCPWIYTGTKDEPHMSGWQHMLRALSQQQMQQPPQQAQEGPSAMDAGPGGDVQAAAAAAVPAAPDARALKDSAIAAIRSL